MVAFDTRNARKYDDLFSLLLFQMAFKQIGLNLVEYFTPILRVKKKLDFIQDHFRSTLIKYIPDQLPEEVNHENHNKLEALGEHMEELAFNVNIGDIKSDDLSYRRY